MNNTLPNLAFIEYGSLSIMQKFMHLPDDLNEKIDEDEETIDSKFTYEFKKTTWGSNFTEKINRNNLEENSARYNPNNKFNFLKASYLTVNTPPIELKSGYTQTIQISLCHNVFHNIIEEGILIIDEEPIQTINTISLDIWSQINMRIGQGFRDLYNSMVGHRDYITGKWTNNIPGCPLECPLPFYYSEHISKALPLLLFSSLSRIEHSFKFRLDYSQLVRMRARQPIYGKNEKEEDIIKEDGSKEIQDWTEWKPIKYNHTYLNSISDREKFPLPNMWGRYSIISPEEKEWRITQQHEYYTEDIEILNTDDIFKYGDSPSIKVNSQTPAKQFICLAENIESLKYNNRSNYTTNNTDISKGWNPVGSIKQNYKTEKRIPEMSTNNFSKIEPWYTCRSSPSDKGFNIYSFAHNPFHIHPDIGVVFNDIDSVIIPTLKNGDPYLNKLNTKKIKSSDENELLIPDELNNNNDIKNIDSPEFRIYIILLVTKRILFEFGKKTIVGYNLPI